MEIDAQMLVGWDGILAVRTGPFSNCCYMYMYLYRNDPVSQSRSLEL